MKPKILRCKECANLLINEQLLQAPNPFAPEETLFGCPNCKSVEGFLPVCDEPDCERVATCGCPTETGYRNTCFEHSEFNK